MTPDEIRRRLSRLRSMDFAGAEKLAADIALDAREPFSALSKLLTAGDAAAARKVETVLRGLGELSILPRIGAVDGLAGDARTRQLVDAFRAFRDLEERVVAGLRAALSDTAVIPPSSGAGPVEVSPPPRRVCDEAYQLLRRLRHPDEPEDEYRRVGLRFARMPESERDRLIAAYVEGRPA